MDGGGGGGGGTVLVAGGLLGLVKLSENASRESCLLVGGAGANVGKGKVGVGVVASTFVLLSDHNLSIPEPAGAGLLEVDVGLCFVSIVKLLSKGCVGLALLADLLLRDCVAESRSRTSGEYSHCFLGDLTECACRRIASRTSCCVLISGVVLVCV